MAKKCTIASHSVLMVVSIAGTEAGYTMELSDGQYTILTTPILPPDPIHSLLLAGRMRAGQKLHTIGAELINCSDKIQSDESTLYPAKSHSRVRLHFNGVRRAAEPCHLGLQRKDYMYRTVTEISLEGGRVGMVDIKVTSEKTEEMPEGKAKISGTDAIDAVESPVEVILEKKWVEGAEKGKRARISWLQPKAKVGNVLQFVGTEETKVYFGV